MLEEADPSQEIRRRNLILTLEGLIKGSGFVSEEFKGSEELGYAGTEANIEQAITMIKEAAQIDSQATKTEVFELLIKYKAIINKNLEEEINRLIRLTL